MRQISLLLLLVLFLASCSESTPPPPPPPPPSAPVTPELHALRDSLDRFFSNIDPASAGVAVLVAYDGEPLYAKAFGMRNIEDSLPLTHTSNMRLASVSKQFTALAVLTLVDQGKLELTDTVSNYFPAAIFEKVTVDQLLHHTSGIADYAMAFEEDTITHKIIENEDVLEWYMRNPPALFEPGTAWEYSNGGYNLLATLVAKISGQNFERYAEEHVFRPAGMNHTHYFNLAQPIDIPERANCYSQDSLGNWTQVDGNFLNGCVGEGSVYTSVMDFLAYDTHLRNRDIVSPESHDLVFGSRTDLLNETNSWLDFAEGKHFSYGMGWFVSDDIAYHTGGWYGTSTIVVHELDRPLTIAMFRNSEGYLDGMMNNAYALTDAYLNELEISEPVE